MLSEISLERVNAPELPNTLQSLHFHYLVQRRHSQPPRPLNALAAEGHISKRLSLNTRSKHGINLLQYLCPRKTNEKDRPVVDGNESKYWRLRDSGLTAEPTKGQPTNMSERIDEFVDLCLVPELLRREERRGGLTEKDLGLPLDLRYYEAKQFMNPDNGSLMKGDLTWNDYRLDKKVRDDFLQMATAIDLTDKMSKGGILQQPVEEKSRPVVVMEENEGNLERKRKRNEYSHPCEK